MEINEKISNVFDMVEFDLGYCYGKFDKRLEDFVYGTPYEEEPLDYLKFRFYTLAEEDIDVDALNDEMIDTIYKI